MRTTLPASSSSRSLLHYRRPSLICSNPSACGDREASWVILTLSRAGRPGSRRGRAQRCSASMGSKGAKPKTLYLVRHAEGFHNVGWEHLDAHLTETGWRQVEALSRYIKSQGPRMPLDAVVVSPLVRTLETASGAFGRSVPASAPLQGLMGGLALMTATQASLHECTSYGPILRPLTGLKMIACELCREEMANPPDKLQHLSLTKKQFPGVDFSLMTEQPGDAAYDAYHAGANLLGEPFSHVVKRAKAFAEYLLTRPEQYIGVVAHVNFNRALLSAFPTTINVRAGRDFENCELMSLNLARDAAGKAVLTHAPELPAFPGGKNSIGWNDPLQPTFTNSYRVAV